MSNIRRHGLLMTAVVAAAVSSTVFIPSALAACDGSPSQIGTATGNPEKDTFGFGCAGQELGSSSPASGSGQRATIQIGTPTSNPEKDTYGYAE